MQRDLNLLFGILAVQIKGVTPRQIVEAGTAWAMNPSQPLSAYLQAQGVLSALDVELIDKICEAAVAAKGSAGRALEEFGGEEQVHKTFRGSLVLRPSGGVESRAVTIDAETGMPETLLSAAEELPGRYSQISEYARGGMGRVLLVHDEHMDREVALKELLMPASEWTGPGDSPVQESAAMASRFLQEARLTGRLEHPAIVPVYELGRRSNGTLYYTMKLVRGKTLSRVLKECHSLQERLALLSNFVDVCQAVAYAHSRGVIHRDIKPANIMVGAFGETVVLDWGLAKARGVKDIYEKELASTLSALRAKTKASPNTTPYETRVGEAVGTPNYMSPEQAEGEIDQISERSDVYSLGVVLYELLSGKIPFDAPSVEEVIKKKLSERPQDIASIEPNAPPELVQVCLKAMQREAGKRYASAGELAEEVKRFMTGSLVQAYSYTPAQMLRRYYRQHRPLVNAVAVAAAAILVAGIFSYVRVVQARDQEHQQRVAAELAEKAEKQAREEAQQQTYVSQLRLSQAYLAEHNYSEARAALWSTPEQLRRWEWALALTLAYADDLLITNPGTGAHAVTFSPDGTHFAAAGASEAPVIYDAQTGKRLVACVHAPERYTALTYSPDGRKLLTPGESGTLEVWDATSGALLHELEGHRGIVYSAEFDAAGDAFVSTATDGIVRVWNTESGALMQTLDANAGSVSVARFSPDGARVAAAYHDGKIRVFDRATGNVVHTLDGQKCTFSPDGSVIAAVLERKSIALYDAASGAALGVLRGHSDAIMSLEFSADSALLLSGSLDRSIQLWDVRSRSLVRRFVGSDKIRMSRFAGSANRILGASHDGTLSLWDAATGGALLRTVIDGDIPASIDVTRDGQRAVVASARGSVQLWPLGNTPWRHTLAANDMRALDYALSPDGKQLAITAFDGTEIRDTRNGMVLKAYAAYARGGSAAAPAFSPDGKHFATTLDEHTPLIINLEDDHIEHALRGHTGEIQCSAYSADGRKLATGAGDATARIWDAASGALLVALTGHSDTVRSVAFSPDGTMLATASADRSVTLWDASTGKALRVLKGHTGAVRCLTFSHAGDRLVTGGDDGVARVWHVASGDLISTQHSSAPLTSVSLSPNDDLLCTSDAKGVTEVFDFNSGTLLLAQKNLKWSTFTPDDGLVTVGSSLDAPVVRWDPVAYSLTQLPGLAGQSWQDRFELYRAEHRAAFSESTGPKAVAERLVVLPEGSLQGRLGELAKALDGVDSGPELLQAIPMTVRDRLQLPATGNITAVNKVPVGSKAALLETLNAAMAGLGPNAPEALSLTAVSAGQEETTLHYTTLGAEHRVEIVALSRSEAKYLLEAELQMVKSQGTDDMPYGADFAGGLLIAATPQVSRDKLQRWKIGLGTRLIAMNDNTLGDAAAFIGAFDGALAELDSPNSAATSFSQAFAEGDFSTVTLRFTVVKKEE